MYLCTSDFLYDFFNTIIFIETKRKMMMYYDLYVGIYIK